jgi:type II secretory pathway component GspD/PulD (secretin)
MAIEEVLKLASEKGGFNLAIGPGIRGSVTLFVEDLQVMRLLELAVDMVGAAYRVEKDVVRVMTRDDYEALYGAPYHDRKLNRTFRVEHAPVQDVAAILAPLRSKNGQIVQDLRSNSLVVNETPYYLDQMGAVIRSIDQPMETKAFDVERVPAAEMAERLKGYLPANVKVAADAAANRVLVTASPAVTAQAQELLLLLDRTEGQETWSFTLDYADPDTTLSLVKTMLTPELSSAHVDRRSRQLIVSDFPSRLEPVRERIRGIDVPTRQVLIEARIMQVSLDEGVKTGIDWRVIEEDLNNLDVSGRFGILSETDDGIRILNGSLADKDYEVTVEALETFGSTDLLSSPRILVADGQKARILVGSQVPYVTVDTRVDQGGGTERYEKVTVVDVGVQLDVEVAIHLDGTVEMLVEPEVSSVTSFVVTGSGGEIPVVETSTTTSRILVKDRETVILGGLKRTEARERRNGIPILSRIPILKYVFSSVETRNVETELAIFLTPTIVEGMTP